MHFGWLPKPDDQDRFCTSLALPTMEGYCFEAMARAKAEADEDVHLWNALLAIEPDWARAYQGIGDCVSWGAEIAVTVLMGILARAGLIEWQGEAATESIYGGSRVEVHGKRSGGWKDGSNGSWAGRWLNEWGVLLRHDYSKTTGNAEHDLRKYSSKKAKDWGNYGCGGKSDKAALDGIAKLRPVKEVTRLTSIAGCEAAIKSYSPFTIASGVGFNGDRDSDGIIRRRGSWNHQMAVIGLRYRNGEPHFRIINSNPPKLKGPDPGITHPAISAISWWCVPEDMEKILAAGDTWAFSGLAGFERPKVDLRAAAQSWSK